MYVHRQYGDILHVSDDSDGEESYESIIHIPEETEADTINTFTEDLQLLCEYKALELEEKSYMRFDLINLSILEVTDWGLGGRLL